MKKNSPLRLRDLIAVLSALEKQYGNVPVGAWHYAGGPDFLYQVRPQYDAQQKVVLIEPECDMPTLASRP